MVANGEETSSMKENLLVNEHKRHVQEYMMFYSLPRNALGRARSWPMFFVWRAIHTSLTIPQTSILFQAKQHNSSHHFKQK
jgi:hypothetical protein